MEARMKVLQGRLTATVRVRMALLLTLVCSAASAQQVAKSAADYWPFREGSTWTIVATVGEKKVTQVITVTKVTTKDGKTRAELDYKTGGRSVQIETYEVDAASIVRISAGPNGANKLTPPLPVVQFPLTAGKKWKWKGEVAVGGSSLKATAQLTVGGSETVKTEAGSFRAMRVHLDLEVLAGEQTLKVPNDYWFAPGVGMVKQKATVGAQEIEGLMTSYKLAK
jgi:hypothetical protein